MATVSFYLNPPNRKNEYPVFLTYQSKGKKFRYYTNVKVNKEDWNHKTQKIKPSSNIADVNMILISLKSKIQKIEAEAIINGTGIDLDYIKKRFLEEIRPNKSIIPDSETGSSDFFNYYEQYIEASKTNKSPCTVINIYENLSKLKKFEKECNYKLSFETINHDFYQRFLKYLINDCNHLNNTVGRHIKRLKSFLNYATDIGCNKNYTYNKFKTISEDVEIVYLTEKELFKLLNLEIKDEKLSKIRDMFCFACFTGLRYSDIYNLSTDQIKEDNIFIRTKKTKDMLIIPLVKYAKQILGKYNENGKLKLPKVFSNNINDIYIKKICKLAGIDEPTKKVSYSGSNKIEKVLPKYEFVSFHTSRRTFITLALEKGMRAEVIMQITGHKSYSTFKKYIKITDKVKSDELNRIWN